MYSSVSLVAYPNIIPWSPAPVSRSSLRSPALASSALSTPIAISADCWSRATNTAHELPSRPFLPSSYPISVTVFLTIAGMSSCAFVVISPVTRTNPVQLAVSQATRLIGSCSKHASRMASETMSQTLSGCPSVTDSEVNNFFSLIVLLLFFFW